MQLTRLITAAAVTLLTCLTARAQDLTVRAAPQARPVCIINGTVHTVSGEVIEGGYVYFVDGVIQAVGPEPLPRFTSAPEFVDARGLHVYPGLISAYTQLGLIEIGSVRPSRDTDEAGDFTPEVVAATAINPDSWFFPVTRINGVLAAGVFPMGGMFPGRASVVQLEGWTPEDMTVKRDAGQVINWPAMRAVRAWWVETPESDQNANIKQNMDRLRARLDASRAYFAARAADPSRPLDLRYEAMRAVLPAGGQKPGKPALPVFIDASDYDQIVSAVTTSIEYGLRPVIVGGRDAWMCADLLKQHDVPVVINSTLLMPKRDDSAYDETYTLPARLAAAGVRFCIASGEETPHERNLPYAAAMAAAHGLDRAAALKAVTLWPAQILGVDGELGALEAGKAATLIITTGDPLEVTTLVKDAFIHGRRIPMTSKQTDLAEKYREKYRQMKDVKKP